MTITFKTFSKIALLAAALVQIPAGYASIIINGTRVIYPSNEKEVTVKITNKGASPVLIQSWMDKGDTDAKPENIKVPFVLTPPINRVDPDKGQTLRISYTGASLPNDRESVYWLNVLEIPAKKAEMASENYLQLAFRSRIKVFMRPAGLSGDASDAAKALSWRSEGGKLKVQNNSGYFVSLATVTVNGKKIDAPMVAPKNGEVLPANATAGQKLQYIYINDYGAHVTHDAVVQ